MKYLIGLLFVSTSALATTQYIWNNLQVGGSLILLNQLTVPYGGSGATSFSAHDLLLGEGTSAFGTAAVSSSAYPLVSNGLSSDPSFQFLSVPGGGTGDTTLSAHGVLLGEGTSAITSQVGSAGTVLNMTSGDPQWTANPQLGNNGTSSGAITLEGGTSGVITIQGLSGVYGTYNFNLPTTAGSSGQPLLSGGGGSSAQTYGTLGISGGGTNNGSLAVTAGGVLYTDGSKIVNVGAGTTGNVLQSNGASAPTWAVASGGGGGGGSKNYLTTYVASTSSSTANTGNGNFELNSTTGWSLGHVSALTNGFPSNTSPTFGSGASGNLTISAISSGGQIAGNYSGSYGSTVSSTAGDFLATSAFYIDTEDQAKVLTFKFYYQVGSNPANINWSGTSSNSFGVAIWDVTNSQWIQPAGTFSITQSSGTGYATGTFQTTSNSAQYRLVLYNANATTGSFGLTVDDFSVGPQTAPMGPAMTDWVSYTPTGSFTTNTTYTGLWRRVGDSMEVQAHLAFAGAPNSVSMTVNLPSGFTINTAKLLSSTATVNNLGQAVLVHVGSNAYPAVVAYSSTTAVGIFENQAPGSPPGPVNMGIPVTQAAPFTVANTDFMDVWFKVPISGWSSNSAMSSDTDTRVVGAYYNSSSPSGTLTSSYNTVTFGTKISDTHAAYSSGSYTIPVTGFYDISGASDIAGTYAANGNAVAGIHVDGSLVAAAIQVAGSTSVTELFPSVSIKNYPLNAGQVVTLKLKTTASGASFGASAATNYFSISRESGPAVIAATESVNMTYQSSAGTSISNSSTVNVPFATKIFDSHNAYNTSTGIYTVPVSGKYRVTGNVSFATSVYAIANILQMSVYQNGADVLNGPAVSAQTTSSIFLGTSISGDVSCNAGDTLEIRMTNNRTAGATLLSTSQQVNFISIERIGN